MYTVLIQEPTRPPSFQGDGYSQKRRAQMLEEIKLKDPVEYRLEI